MVASNIGSIATTAEAVDVKEKRAFLSETQKNLLTTHNKLNNLSENLSDSYQLLSAVQAEAGNLGSKLISLQSDLHRHMEEISATTSEIESQLQSVDSAIKKFDETGSLRHAASLRHHLYRDPVSKITNNYFYIASNKLQQESDFQKEIKPSVEQAVSEVSNFLQAAR